MTHGVSVVGVAGWPVILTGWPAGRWRVSQPAADAERYRCACAGGGDGYQCGLDWGRSRLIMTTVALISAVAVMLIKNIRTLIFNKSYLKIYRKFVEAAVLLNVCSEPGSSLVQYDHSAIKQRRRPGATRLGEEFCQDAQRRCRRPGLVGVGKEAR